MWKAPWHKRLLLNLIWIPRRFVYRLLGLPDEIEENIGGLKWAVEQNRQRIEKLEGFLVLEEIVVEADEVVDLPDGGLFLSGVKIVEDKE